jgi:hypothetical protein
MSCIFNVGVIHYKHTIVEAISIAPMLLEYVGFVMGMHTQGHWGSIGVAEYEANNQCLAAGTSVSSEYELAEEFQQFADALIITTDIALGITIISLST